MGATSVTGKGQGAAFNNKGPHNGRNVYVPLLSPHIVAAGHATTAGGGTVTVTFPEALPLAAANYVVMLTAADATTTLPRVTTKTDSSSKFASFVITAEGSKSIAWAVMTDGYGA
ncbi:MAG: hypothetical protein DWQ19_12085 [Crenarchaeota archaeon]|nr:MAG: hypothetical protein DWQ19_12085 [Thermoproteota archaeon]